MRETALQTPRSEKKKRGEEVLPALEQKFHCSCKEGGSDISCFPRGRFVPKEAVTPWRVPDGKSSCNQL